MPYGFEDAAMMVANHAPRLRHYWHFCRWVNESASVKALTGNTLFHIEDGRGKNLKYFLQDAFKDFYKPVAEEEDAENGDHGIFDLFLYKIGQDETTTRMITGKSGFDGTLVVRSKLQFFFDDHDGSEWKDDEERLNYMRSFQSLIDLDLNGKFFIESATDPDFKKIYLQFVPHYYFEGSTTSDHFEIEVKANKNPGVKYPPDFFEDDFDDDDFSVDVNQDRISIMRYVLGLKPYKVVPATGGGTKKESITVITAAELSFLAQWVAQKRGGGHVYQVKS
jgi:hypothetical protein